MKFHRFVVLILVVVLLSSACGSPAEPATTTTEPTTTTAAPASSTTEASPEVARGLVYGTWGEDSLTLSMYVPIESDGAPVVIFFPGRMLGSMPRFVRDDLVAHGAIVFVVEYPFGDHPETPGEELISDQGAGYRATAESAACAIHYARARASEQGSESPVVVLAGHSMGGGVAALAALFGDGIGARWEEYALAQGGPPRQVDCEITDGSTQVDAIVGLGGSYDLYVEYEGGFPGDFIQNRDPDLWEFLYGSIGENPDLRVRLIHGETDTVVPYNVSVDFEVVLAEAGYDVRLTFFDGGHGNMDLLAPTIIDAIQP